MSYEIRSPLNDVSDTICEVVEWFFANGDKVAADDELCELACMKAAVVIEAGHAGYLRIEAPVGREVEPGELLAVIDKEPPGERKPAQASEGVEDQLFTAKAERLLEEHGLDRSLFASHQGVVRESHVRALLGAKRTFSPPRDRSLGRGRVSAEFLKRIASDEAFARLSSSEKIGQYRDHGAIIGEGVVLGDRALILAGEIVIGEGSVIAEDCRLEADILQLGRKVRVGPRADWFAHSICVGDGTRFADSVRMDVAGGLTKASVCEIGKNCLLCMETYVNACREVTMGDGACLSPRAMIFTHSFWHSVLDGGDARFAPVRLEDGAWIGAGAQVLPGVTVGAGATLVSNSLADANIPEKATAAGIPASVVRSGRKSGRLSEKNRDRMIEFLALRLDYLGKEPDVSFPERIVSTADAEWAFARDARQQRSRMIHVAHAPVPEPLPEGGTWFDLDRCEWAGVDDDATALTADMLRRFGILCKQQGGFDD